MLIFDRPIKDCPLFFEATEHNPPVVSFGSRGTKDKGFVQPCNVAVASFSNSKMGSGRGGGDVFVVDTGNSRIKRLTRNLDFDGHLHNECLEGRSVTGICMGAGDESLHVINWRTKTVAEISVDGGATVNAFTHADFREPIDLALDPRSGRILVADNGLGALLVFEPSGKLVRALGPRGVIPEGELKEKEEQEEKDEKAEPSPPQQGGSGRRPGRPAAAAATRKRTTKSPTNRFKDLSAVCVARTTGEYLCADGLLYVFSPETGALVREFGVPGFGSKGRFGGLSTDDNGFLLATHSVKKQSFIQVRMCFWVLFPFLFSILFLFPLL